MKKQTFSDPDRAGEAFPVTMKILYRTKGLFQDLIVTREGGIITLSSSEGIRHTVFNSTAPHLPGLEYARNVLAALAFNARAQSCLVLGLGGGSIPRMLLAARPQLEMEAVEIDPAIVELAGRYFGIRALPRLRIHLEDAATFLGRCTSRFGIVIVDTYIGEKLPDQCATREFIRNAGKCLLDDGVLVVNWLSGEMRTRENLLKNLKSIVGPVWLLPGLTSHNLLYFARAGATTRREIISTAAAIESEIPFDNSIRKLVQRLRRAG